MGYVVAFGLAFIATNLYWWHVLDVILKREDRKFREHLDMIRQESKMLKQRNETMQFKITTLEEEIAGWVTTGNGMRVMTDKATTENRNLKNENEFITRKHKAIRTITELGYTTLELHVQNHNKCIYCRAIGLPYCMSEVIHGKKNDDAKVVVTSEDLEIDEPLVKKFAGLTKKCRGCDHILGDHLPFGGCKKCSCQLRPH